MIFVALIIYAIIIVYASKRFAEKSTSTTDFLNGGGKLPMLPMALSIAATWIWAPALFSSAEEAYIHGVPGVFWFVVPNVLCLLLFIPFALKMRKLLPNGVTLSGYMDHVYSPRVRKTYTFQLGLLALLSTSVQLLAGGKLLALMLDMPFWMTTLALGLFAYYYSKDAGIKASVMTDAVQMTMMLAAVVVFVPWALNINGADALKNGLAGASGEFGSLFDANGLWLFLAVGIPSTIARLSGPFGDQSFWQRAFSVNEKDVAKSLVWGSILFAIVPIGMAILGLIAAGSGFTPTEGSIVNFELVASMFPDWAVWIFMFMLLSGLLSTIDSNMCSFAGLMHTERKTSLANTKHYMLALALVAALLANIPGLSIFHMFLLYGVIRAVTMIVTGATLFGVKFHEAGIFYGILTSMFISVPIFIYGNVANDLTMNVIGSLSSPILTFVVAYAITKYLERKKAPMPLA